jgi:RHS repeat-associated protein
MESWQSTAAPIGSSDAIPRNSVSGPSEWSSRPRPNEVSGPGATTYTYDANGNERTAGSATYAYDLADRLVAATVGTTTVTYTWSGDGVRLSAATGTGAATTIFLVDRAMALPSVALERDGTGTVLRTDIYGLGRISVINATGGIAYEHTDALGSVTDLVSSSGVPLGWAEYGPYGAVRSAGAQSGVPADPFGFTGQYLDGTTGLYHLRARQYDPGTGRFLAVDPVGQNNGDPVVGAYVYARNNPAVGADPSGLCFPFCVAAAIGGLIGAGAGLVGYTASAIITGQSWDPGQAAAATLTSAGAGAVCGATLGLGCVAASVAASEIQYQASPGEKSTLGYLGAATVGTVTGRVGGGSLLAQSPLRFTSGLIREMGSMNAAFLAGWPRTFLGQFGRSSLTAFTGDIAGYLINRGVSGIDGLGAGHGVAAGLGSNAK